MDNIATNTFGPAFKKLREKRGYSISEACRNGNIMTPAALRKFENTDSSTSIEKFNRLLIAIGASWDDFFRYYRGATVESIFNDFASKYYNSNDTNNYKVFKALKKDKDIIEDNQFLTKLPELLGYIYLTQFKTTSVVNDSNSPEIRAIIDHMKKVESFGTLELTILGLGISLFDYDFVHYQVNKVLQDCKSDNLPCFLPKYRETLKLFFLAISYYHKKGKIKEAEQLIEELTALLSQEKYVNYLHEKVLLKSREIFNQLRQNNIEALDMAKQHVRLLDLFIEDYYEPHSAETLQSFIDSIHSLNKTGIPFDPY